MLTDIDKLYNKIRNNELTFNEYIEVAKEVKKLPSNIINLLYNNVDENSKLLKDYKHIHLYLADEIMGYSNKDAREILKISKQLIDINPHNWDEDEIEYLKQKYKEFSLLYNVQSPNEITIHKKLNELILEHRNHGDNQLLKIRLHELEDIAIRYKNAYEKVKEKASFITIDDKRLKLNQKEEILQHYLDDEDMLSKALNESPLIELRMGVLESIDYFILEHLEYKDIDKMHNELSTLSNIKREYEELLNQIKVLFFDILYQSTLEHTKTKSMTQNPDIHLELKEELIDICSHEGLFHLLYESKLSFKAMLKIVKRADSYSFHLIMRLYKAIWHASKRDKHFLVLHLYIIPHLFQYPKEDINHITKSTLIFIKENPYNWSEAEKKELLKLCDKAITDVQKAPKNSLSLMMMKTFKKCEY